MPLGLAVYYVLCPAEVSSNLSRYDGQRYGFTSADAKDLDASFKESRSIGFGKEAKRRIKDWHLRPKLRLRHDAYYKKPRLSALNLSMNSRLPLKSTTFAWPHLCHDCLCGWCQRGRPLQMYLTDIMTVAVNLAGIPAISIPAGVSSDDQMPVGSATYGRQKQDKELLDFAAALEMELQNDQQLLSARRRFGSHATDCFWRELVLKRRAPKLNQSKISGALEGLQQHLPQKQTWPLAIINADKMVDDALKARRLRAKPWASAWSLPNAT